MGIPPLSILDPEEYIKTLPKQKNAGTRSVTDPRSRSSCQISQETTDLAFFAS
jgi:hypothetical protein